MTRSGQRTNPLIITMARQYLSKGRQCIRMDLLDPAFSVVFRLSFKHGNLAFERQVRPFSFSCFSEVKAQANGSVG